MENINAIGKILLANKMPNFDLLALNSVFDVIQMALIIHRNKKCTLNQVSWKDNNIYVQKTSTIIPTSR